MFTVEDALVSSEHRVLPLRLRADLTFRRHHYQGTTFWVVKEPIGLQYFRFQEEEYRLLRMLDGTVSLTDLRDRFSEEFAPQRVSLQTLHRFLGRLFQAGLIVVDAAGQGERLKRLDLENRRQRIISALTNILAIRFPGVDPQPVLSRLIRYVRWMYTPAAVAAWCLLAVSALALVTMNFETFQSRLPAFQEFFNATNLVWLLLTIGACKVLHELGHGLTCVRYGGECHSIGFMLLVFSPAMYCDVSDSWVLPNKWQRIAIGIGGMYVEVLLASIATFVWWFTEPGLLNHICLSVIFVCSVSTLLVNSNPLMRFDGYYILSDLLEVPNLSGKARSALQRVFFLYVLGLDLRVSGYPQRRPLVFACYAVASTIYRWMLFGTILLILYRMLEPYGLKVVGQIVAGATAALLIGQPLFQIVKVLRVPGNIHRVKWKRTAFSLGLLAVVLAGVMLIPLPHYVYGPARAEFRDAAPVAVEVDGVLEEVLVRPGDKVAAGQPLARLKNWELEMRLVDLERQRDELLARLDIINKTRLENAADAREVEVLEKLLRKVEVQLENSRRDEARLAITAPVGGVVLAPPGRPARPDQESILPHWSGTPVEPENRGAYLKAGDLLCQVGDPARLDVMVVVDESEVEFVRKGQATTLRLASDPLNTRQGQVREIAQRELQNSPQSLSNQAGGTLATRVDAAGNLRPLHTSYLIRVPLNDASGRLREGVRGKGCIEADWMPLGQWLWYQGARLFRFEM
jgi:putative peptide zinc metalloprotease protein